MLPSYLHMLSAPNPIPGFKLHHTYQSPGDRQPELCNTTFLGCAWQSVYEIFSLTPCTLNDPAFATLNQTGILQPDLNILINNIRSLNDDLHHPPTYNDILCSYPGLLIAEECRIPRDLLKESPIADTGFRSKDGWIFLHSVDHLAVDAIGFDLLERELMARYPQVIDEDALMPASNNPMFRFLNKQKEIRTNEVQNLLFWKQHLKTCKSDPLVKSNALFVPGNTLNYHLEEDALKILNDVAGSTAACYLISLS